MTAVFDREEVLSEVQQVIAAISGYSISSAPGARSDYYYDECHTESQKLTDVHGWASVYNITLSDYQARQVVAFLDADMQENERFHAFKALSDEE